MIYLQTINLITISKIEVQQNLNFNTNNSTEGDNTNNENTLQQQNQNENYNDDNQTIENNTSEFTTQESTISTQNASQVRTSTSTHTRSFRIPTRVVYQRQNPQSYLDASPNRIITFNLPRTDKTTHDETHNTLHEDILTTSHAQNTSVNVASPTRTIPDTTRYITRPRYDPPSNPSAFRSDRSIYSNNNRNDNHKLPINNTIHSIITFLLLHQIQILIQISTKVTLNLIRIQQHKTLSYNYHKPVPHRIIYILKIKELRILQLLILIPHNLLKKDFKILHLRIYQLIRCIKCIQVQILILIEIQFHYHKIQLNIYLLNSHNK